MNLVKGAGFSVIFHILLVLVCFGFIRWQKANAINAIELDLSAPSLLLKPADSRRQKTAVLPEEWFLAVKGSVNADVKSVTKTARAEEATSECPPPCPSVSSDWKAASSSMRKPQWLEGMITENDYPAEARKRGEEGLVKVQVLIDTAGSVREVIVLSSKNSEFSELVKNKLLSSRFSPALDDNGNPMNVRMTIPIVFRLR